VISNITVPFVGIVDIALVGRMGSSAYIGGVGFGAMVFTLIYTGLAFLRMGTTGLTAQAYGASEFKEASNSLFRALIFALFAAVLLILLQVPIKNLLILNLDGSVNALGFAAEYFNYRIWAAPATLSVFVFMGWFIGMQNSRIPMIITIIISFTNIVLSSFFVVVLEMKIEGVALGTVIAQYTGLIFCLYFFNKKYRRIASLFDIKSILILVKLKRFFSVSRDIFIRSLLLTGSFFLFNVLSASFGEDILALNSMMLQFLWFFAWVTDGFAYAGGTLAGRYIGAEDKISLREAVNKSVLFGFFLALGFTLIYLFAGQGIIHILTDNPAVIHLAKDYHIWIWIMPVLSFLAFLYDGIYVGATATAKMRNIMIVSVILIYLPALFVLKYYFGNQGMWMAIMLLLAARGIGLKVFLKQSVYGKVFKK
jgi:MATE family multidrug resistance protein